MYSLYRAHSTGAKGFHKRATQQGKQYKKAGTLFCGNGQNSTLRLPQHSRIYTQVSLQGEHVLLDLAGLLSTESMISWPVDPTLLLLSPPHMEVWSAEAQRSHAGAPGRLRGETPAHPPGLQGHVLLRKYLHQDPGV